MAKLKHHQLTPQAELLLSEHAPHRHNLLALKQQKLWPDAMFYTALMLPYRQTLEMALTLIAMNYEQQLKSEQRLLLQHARRWHASSGDPLRHELFQLADEIGFEDPISCLVLSIFWSEGSMTSPDLEAVYPPEHMAPVMLANVLSMIFYFFVEDPALQTQYVDKFYLLAER